MGMMMAVSFERYGRLYYLDPGAYSPSIGDKVLVPTDSGPEVAECVWAPQWVSDDIDGLPVCAGLAGADDLARDERNRRRRAEGRLASKRLIRQHELPMKLTAVDYISADNTFVIYFSAPQRVDFRALVRDLGGRLKARVELRQIGPRDEARLQGGIGPCGRDLCCATFLKDFEPVSVRMAKDQDLPVNPLRIAGACGRLMCCLKYEHPLYQEFRKDAPKYGSTVDTPAGPGTVVGHNVPSDTVVVKLAADGTSCACPRASVCGSRQAYEAFHGRGQLFRKSYGRGSRVTNSPRTRTERGQIPKRSEENSVFRLGSSVVAAAALAAVAGLSTPAFASTSFADGASRVVFVQTDNTAGNRVVAYHRAADGTLTQAGSYPTGGAGGILTGSAVDHLASQGSLGYDPRHGVLFAVNAGSNTVSVFAVHGDRLALRQVIGSGGTFPVSVAVHGALVYVLNALNGGSVTGYRDFGGFLVPVPGSSRPLGLDPAATPQFTNTPGQVAFTPDGSRLIVTTKANGNDIDVFRVGFDGRLSAKPAVNPEPGTVPFAISFDAHGNLVIANAGNNSLATFTIDANGTLSQLDSVGTGQAATCWVAPAGQFLFVSNAGSASVTGFTASVGGQLTDLGNTATDAGTVDAAAAAGGQYLYVQAGGAGIVDEYRVGAGGSLSQIGSVTVPGAAGGEGILAF